MTKLLVVEDNVSLATTLVRFLNSQDNLEVVALTSSAESALAKLKDYAVDLVLIDIALPGMSGIDLITMVRKYYPQLPCIVLSAHDEGSYVRRALSAGAKGYVSKSEPLAILIAIKQVLAGESYLSADLRQKIYH